MNQNQLNEIMQNFNDENIKAIRKSIEAPQDSAPHTVYRLVQKNVPCDVVITKSSRKKCVKSLLK